MSCGVTVVTALMYWKAEKTLRDFVTQRPMLFLEDLQQGVPLLAPRRGFVEH
jgi:hypothetical protein